MILRTVELSSELSSSQKAAIEKMVGRQLQDRENVVFCCGKPKVASLAERQNAAQQMRDYLYLLDRSQHRPTTEELAAALLESSANDLPA